MNTSFCLSHLLRTVPVALALSAGGVAFAQTPAASCEKIDEKQVTGLFDAGTHLSRRWTPTV